MCRPSVFIRGGLLSIRLHRHSGRSGAGNLLGVCLTCEELSGSYSQGMMGGIIHIGFSCRMWIFFMWISNTIITNNPRWCLNVLIPQIPESQ